MKTFLFACPCCEKEQCAPGSKRADWRMICVECGAWLVAEAMVIGRYRVRQHGALVVVPWAIVRYDYGEE